MSEVNCLASNKKRAGTSPAQSIVADVTTTPAKFQSTPNFWRCIKSTRIYCSPLFVVTTTSAKNECYDLPNFMARGEGHGQSNWTAARVAVDEKSAVASLLCSLCAYFCACCFRYVFSLVCAQGIAVAADVTIFKCLGRVAPRGIDGGYCSGGANS